MYFCIVALSAVCCPKEEEKKHALSVTYILLTLVGKLGSEHGVSTPGAERIKGLVHWKYRTLTVEATLP